jgi:hypothetical protein
MEKEFLPYKESLELKELGFNEPCMAIYLDDKLSNGTYTIMKDLLYLVDYTKNVELLVPTYSQAFRWFRENHNLQHEITRQGSKYWLLTIFETDKVTANGVFNGKRYNLDEELNNEPDTYEEAELECIKKLIEIVKKQKI